jgi:radical SAM protein with 4Fe4S-binding SPASM domain
MASASLTASFVNKLTIILTHRCNQQCEFCFDASNVMSASREEDISFQTLQRILNVIGNSVPDKGLFNITFSGGEPTLHPEFLKMAKMVSDAGFPLTILTNGQRFSDVNFMKKVMQYNIWNFQFSIEGASATIHDKRVGSKGGFNRTIKAIENARDLGVRFITNTTLTKYYESEMFSLIDLLDQLGVPKMNIGNTLPECAGHNWSFMMQYPTVVDIAECLNLYALTKKISFSFITPLPQCLKENRFINNPSVCSAGRVSIVVDIDGNLMPCSVCTSMKDDKLNIQDVSNLNEIYHHMDSLVSKHIKNDIPAECLLCNKLDTCRAACPLYWKANGVAHPLQWVQSS